MNISNETLKLRLRDKTHISFQCRLLLFQYGAARSKSQDQERMLDSGSF